MRERALGRKVERLHWGAEQWRGAYAQQAPGAIQTLLAIGVAIADTPAGVSSFGNWNKTFIPEFAGTPLDELFVNTHWRPIKRILHDGRPAHIIYSQSIQPRRT